MTARNNPSTPLSSINYLLLALLLGQIDAVRAAPRIDLEEFRVEPAELPLGESFVVRVRASATGVALGSFLLRTAEVVDKGETIPGFSLYSNGKYYVAQDGRYHLLDNGKLDDDPEVGSFRLEVSTRGWKEGTRRFAFFASCRPHAGPFVAARRDFAVIVKGDRVSIEDLGAQAAGPRRVIRRLDVGPLAISAGEPVTISLEIDPDAVKSVELSNPYYIDAAETLPGFHYEAAKKKSFFGSPSSGALRDNGPLDRDPASGRVAIEMDTHGWPPGVFHLRLDAVGRSGEPLQSRSFAVKVASKQDRLQVVVQDSYRFAPGTHFGRFVKLADGTLLCEDQRSVDGGRTWHGATGGFGVGGEPLQGGRVLGLAYRCLPTEGEKGWYDVERFVSIDEGRHFQASRAKVSVAQAKAAQGHAFHPGPLFMRSIVERADRSLVALMAGWFQSDTALCPYGRGRPYSRSYVCQSHDGGGTWEYLSTIGYGQIGSEGYNEGCMRRLPGGDWLAVLRTGSEKDFNCQDNPIMWSRSRDEGRHWSAPQRTGLQGAYPSLAVLDEGLVVIGYGRPGAMIAFSADGGSTWTDRTVIDATPYSGYTDVVQTGPGELLVGFGVRDYLDEETGRREDQLRLARVRFSP